MANRYANLVGANKIKDEYQKINTGFDKVEQEMDAEVAAREELETRVDTIINDPSPNKDAELVDIRTPDPSYTPDRTINVAGDITRDMQAQFNAHKADTVQDPGGVHGLEVEPGTWIPTLEGIEVAGTQTYSIQEGSYYRVGNLIVANFRIRLTAKDPATDGNLIIRGLPYYMNNSMDHSVSFSRYSYVTLPSGYTQLSARVSGTSIFFFVNGSGVSTSFLQAVSIADNTEFFGAATYYIN